jgi:SAM-dependent methyltransferase
MVWTPGDASPTFADTRCPLCSEDSGPRFVLATGAAIRWCQRCDLGVTQPRPEPDYRNYVEVDRDADLWARFAHELIQFMLASARPSSLFDFGAGSGDLVLAASTYGITAVGIEVDQRSVRLARERGVVIHERLDELEHPCDAATISHVLEHVDDPVGLLTDIRSHLTPGGLLVVAQPNAGGLLPRLLSDHWSGWVVNEHLWHFTPRSLIIALERAGFAIVQVRVGSLHRTPRPLRGLPVYMAGRIANALGRGDQLYAIARADAS